jgi:calcineurin-like phosphoesterase family protein
MQSWMWSDLHIGHVKLAEKWRADKCGGDVTKHNEWLRDAWNDSVSADDHVWIVGDACMGTLTDSLEFADTLKGVKHLIPGNHDRFHPAYRWKNEVDPVKSAEFKAMYDEVFVTEPFSVSGEYMGLNAGSVVVNHFPWADTIVVRESGRDERGWIENFGAHREAYPAGTVLVHGHTHSQYIYGDMMVHVGVDSWPEGPVHFDAVRYAVNHARAREGVGVN